MFQGKVLMFIFSFIIIENFLWFLVHLFNIPNNKVLSVAVHVTERQFVDVFC